MESKQNKVILKILFLSICLFAKVKPEEISLDNISTDIETDNYIISSNVLSLISEGNFKLSGSCNECQIVINKNLEITLTINSITIDNSNTGPFVIKKSSKLNLILEGESVITDNELLENEELLDDFEGAGIKIKSSSSLTIDGTGQLTIKGNTKNGIKGGENSIITINNGIIIIDAIKSAMACDNIITINGGTISIKSENDGIKAEPDSDDNNSKGTIEINGGNININSKYDAIQAGYSLIINGGTFDIKTFEGADASGFNEDTMSAKGIKCSTNEHENIENIIKITGGTFTLNTKDDAIHSDYNISITGGAFDINTGDDGVHAEKYLVLGQLNADNNLINMTIKKSYEGLEGSNIYIYSGTYNIISSDDGINSAGDTDEICSGTDRGGVNPKPGGTNIPPGGGGGRPMNLRHLRKRLLQQNQCYSFHIFIYGGDIYVNSESDGLDANGDITIYGGNLEVWGMSSGGDGDPIDQDGTLTINGGTILAGGSQGMEPIHLSVETIAQDFIYSTDTFQANKEMSIRNGNNVIRTFKIPKRINYLFYTSKDTNTDYLFSDGNTLYKSDAIKDLESNPRKNDRNKDQNNSSYSLSFNYLVLFASILLFYYY